MRSKNRIYTFFTAVALMFWNPLSFNLTYGNTPIHSFKLIHFLFWSAFIIGIFFIYLLAANKTGKRTANIFFSISIAGILFSLIVLADGLIGMSSAVKKIKLARSSGLLFEPRSKVSYHTAEFNYAATINSIGLRDKEISVNKNSNYSILCIGDSWTFGWGVDVENSWPKKLEQYLKQEGIKKY